MAQVSDRVACSGRPGVGYFAMVGRSRLAIALRPDAKIDCMMIVMQNASMINSFIQHHLHQDVYILAKGVKSELEQDVVDIDGGALLRNLFEVVGDNLGLLNKHIAGVVCQMDIEGCVNDSMDVHTCTIPVLYMTH